MRRRTVLAALGAGLFAGCAGSDPPGAAVVDDRLTRGDPGVVAFSLTNVGDRTQAVLSGTVPPFSVLWAAPGTDDRALLRRDYAEGGCVTTSERGHGVGAIGITTPVDPGETIEKRYELRPAFDRDALADYALDAPGQYSFDETLSYRPRETPQGPSTEVDWTVTFELVRR